MESLNTEPEPLSAYEEEMERERQIAPYVWKGLMWRVYCGNATYDDIEAIYVDWFPTIPHEERI